MENSRLRDKIDELEQYGRRSLTRVSGTPETPNESTNEVICKLFSEIDSNFNVNELERSHRNGVPPPMQKHRSRLTHVKRLNQQIHVTILAQNLKQWNSIHP